MRILPLIEASLKGFIRNKRSIILLVIFPLILISVVFLSFNSKGLGRVPAGLVASPDFKETAELEDAASFLSITYYSSLDKCLHDLKNYYQYMCIQPEGSTSYIFNIYFDNTREPVIWEVLEKTKTAVDIMQEEKSKEMATNMLSSFDTIGEKIGYFKNSLAQVSVMIDRYITETDSSITELRSAKNDLSSSIDSMEQDINSLSSTESRMRQSKARVYTNSMSQIRLVENNVDNINATRYEDMIYVNSIRSTASSLKSQLDDYNTEADGYFYEMDQKIASYRQSCQQGRQYVLKMDQSISKLQKTKGDLANYKGNVQQTSTELSGMEAEIDQIGSISPDAMVNPIIIVNKPVYRPGENDSQGAPTIISLQTIFPQMLLLIVMFLSLLVSSFIALSEINLPANIRVSIIRGITLQEFAATYISSLMVVMFPIFIVLVLGEDLFKLHIFGNFASVAVVLFLVTTIFIIIGISVAYIVKNESIALVITTFMLLFLIFFSGYILPVERMSPGSKFIAEISPGTIALGAFNKIVFYDISLENIYAEIVNLMTWTLLAISAGVIIKKLTNY